MSADFKPADSVVVVGAGHGGFQLGVSLRHNGFTGRIQVVNDEPFRPYQRPPLSKTYLKGEGGIESIAFRPDQFFADQQIEMVADRAVAINRAGHHVRLASGTTLDYGHLVLATGAHNRRLEAAGDLAGVAYIRTLEETEALRLALPSVKRVVIVGAGFIGLEFAATARAKGLPVDVVELGTRVMGRAVSPAISDFFRARHEASGIRFHFGAQVVRCESESGRISGVVLDNGETLAADLVVVGIGIVPNTLLAAEAELEVAGGVVVDEHLLTADASISAIGDCALFPHPAAHGLLRLESVQNANDQARCVAARLTGKPHAYVDLPWFWSDQGPDKLQIAGLTGGYDSVVLRGDPATNAFSVFCYRGQQLLGVESVNRAADHMVARRALGAGRNIPAEAAADPGVDLKKLAA